MRGRLVQTKYMRYIKMKLLILALTVLGTTAFAYDDDEDKIDVESGIYMALVAGGILLVGYIISQIKFAEKAGSTISVIGLIVGGLGLLGVALFLLEWAKKTAITLVLYIGALLLAGYIIYQIYLWLKALGKRKD